METLHGSGMLREVIQKRPKCFRLEEGVLALSFEEIVPALRGLPISRLVMVFVSKLVAIIEDDAVLRRGLRRFFKKEDCEVIDFENGLEASVALNYAKPDMIFCDYDLPDLNGLEILRAIRKDGKQTPFFLITGYYTEELSEKAEASGATDTFEKPIDLDTLRNCCRL